MEIVYTVHHCWKALLEEGLHEYFAGSAISIRSVGRSKELPSSCGPGYALFRIEEVNNESGEINRSTHATSRVFEYLDPKDALYRELLAAKLQHLMPPTLLLEWDADVSEQRSQHAMEIERFFVEYGSCASSSSSASLSPQRLLLKAALGAGGYGLYFVGNAADCWEVIQGHRIFAQSRARFVEGLQRDYGSVPAWSLQALVQPVRSDFEGHHRKTQIRAYLCAVDGVVFVYTAMEVRLPIWEEEEEPLNITDAKACSSSSTEADDIEEKLCGKGSALPYNRGRSKSRTMRLMLHEVKELQGSYEPLKACVLQFAKHLSSRTAAAHASETNVECGSAPTKKAPSRMAIIGLDLIVSTQSIYDASCSDQPNEERELESGPVSDPGKRSSLFKAYILEANNNPALPQPDKHRMSTAYRHHLRALCSDLVQLGLGVNGGQISRKEAPRAHGTAAATAAAADIDGGCLVHNFFRT